MELLINVIQQISLYAGLVLGSGIITTLLTQALKWKAVLAPAKKYPRVVAGIIAVALSAVTVSMLDVFVLQVWVDWVIFGGATFLVATQSYDIVREAIKNAKENR